MLIIPPNEKDLGILKVLRMLPYRKHRQVGPWVFFDHCPATDMPVGEGVDVRPHPHINLATVTYTLEGEMFHRDSMGNSLSIKPHDLNIMVAGKGVVHSERELPELQQKERRLELLQLWFALPNEMEEIDPDFFHYDKEELPTIEHDGASIRLLIGEAYGQSSPAHQYSDTLYCIITLKAGHSIVLPNAIERAIHIAKGSCEIDGTTLENLHMAVLDEGELEIAAKEDSTIVVIGGAPIGKRHIWWNFVSSRPERIEQAKEDWRNKKFPAIPKDDEEFIPLPE